jgi:hypothetical protein
MSSETKAKRAKILDMLDGYSNLIGKELTGLTNALCREAEPYPLDVVIAATQRLGRICKFPPTTAEVFEQCEIANAALHPKVVQLYNGMISMDFGHGRIDMTGLTEREQDAIIKNHGMIGKKNAALMSLEEKRDGLKQAQIEAQNKAAGLPSPQTTRRIDVKPRRM